MTNFLQQLTAGLASGSIYAALALALVLLYRVTHVVNFAQGTLAMLSTYLGWYLTQCGLPYWVAFGLTCGASWLAGAAVYRLLIAPLKDRSYMRMTLITIGLALLLGSLAGWAFGFTQRQIHSPFSSEPVRFWGTSMDPMEITQMASNFVIFAALYAFFRYAGMGLAMRAVASQPVSCALLGVRTEAVIAMAWGLSTALSAACGMLVAPTIVLHPGMMGGETIYAMAGATLGGFTPGGAVAGGLLLGVVENVLGTYVPAVGTQLKFTVALAWIILVLVLRPQGLFGRLPVVRA